MAIDLQYLKLKKRITKTNYYGVDKTVTDLSEPTLKPDFGYRNFLV